MSTKASKAAFFKEASEKKKAVKTTAEKIVLVKGDALSVPTNSSIYAEDGEDGFTIHSRSPMLKPAQMPEDKAIRGRFKRFVGCEVQPATKTKPAQIGTMIEIVPDGQHVGVVIPLTVVLRNALQVTGEGESAESPFVGKIIKIQKLAERIPSKQGQDAWNFIVGVKENS